MTTQVVFACVHNAGRSQMAAALFNTLANLKRARAVSAGTEPADRVPPRGRHRHARGGHRPVGHEADAAHG
jgi:protein-tyrosine-phosphatase